MKTKIFWLSWVILFSFFYVSIAIWLMSDYNGILKTLFEILILYSTNFLIIRFWIKKNKSIYIILYITNILIFVKILLYKIIFSITISSLVLINIFTYFD